MVPMFQHLEFIVLHILFFSKNTAGFNNCHVSFSDTGHILTGHVMRTLQHKTFESCTFSCELEPQCFSVNYMSFHKTCEMNNATRDFFPEDMMKQKGAVYIGMVITRRFNLCESMRCENGGTCVNSPSLKCKCRDGFSGLRCETLKSLGMESGAILDRDIFATSSKLGKEASKGRLNRNSCWMPGNNHDNETITVKFGHRVTIVAIATQGAPNDDCWVKSYFIKYGVLNVIAQNVKEYQANSDKNTVVTNKFSTPLYVEWINIRPASWSSCIAMRIELYGY